MMNPSNSNLDEKIDILVDQVGRLTEGLTKFRLDMQHSITEFRADLAEIKAMVKDQSETSTRQAETADRLVRIVEVLLERDRP